MELYLEDKQYREALKNNIKNRSPVCDKWFLACNYYNKPPYSENAGATVYKNDFKNQALGKNSVEKLIPELTGW